jgi:GT2 family glycosyltransferase
VVDDGSTDGTAEALTDIADPRLQVLRRGHEGVGAARNSGAALARGEYLTFLDSDDEALPNWLERFADVLQGASVDVVVCCAIVVEPDGRVRGFVTPADGAWEPDALAPRFLAGCYSLKRALFEAVGGFDPDLDLGENTELGLRLFTHRPQPRFAVVTEALVRQRAPGIRSQAVRAANAEAVLRRHATRRRSFPKLWASYHGIVGASRAHEGRFWQGRYHFLCAVLSDPRSVEQLARLGVSLIPGASRLVWRRAWHLRLQGLPHLFQAARQRLWTLKAHGNSMRTLRRHAEEVVDQIAARSYHRLAPVPRVAPFDGDPRLALITVNFSTTHFLKLMLCTLGEQSELWFVQRIVIIDNHSRDGGAAFLRALETRVARLHVVERRHFLSHAAGMRAGVRALDCVERGLTPDQRAGLVLFCDPDVVFRNTATLLDLSAAMVRHDAAFLGEARLAPSSGHPDVQASFFAVRRDLMARRDVQPLVNHGSPAYGMQASMLRAGLRIVDFPSNHGGYVLHRGRTAVAAATTHGVGSYAGVANRNAHFMGVANGAHIWADIERRWAQLLLPEAEPALLDHLEHCFAVAGRTSAPLAYVRPNGAL